MVSIWLGVLFWKFHNLSRSKLKPIFYFITIFKYDILTQVVFYMYYSFQSISKHLFQQFQNVLVKEIIKTLPKSAKHI